MRALKAVAVAFVLAPTLAWGAIGQIAVVEGDATRTPKDGKPEPLKVGTAVELHDTLEVKKGNVKLVLNDESVLMLAEKSKLYIDEAAFSGQERQGFSAKLLLGKVWAKVSKALGAAKFEISTDRAVAGVRGTIFRIDADTVVKAAKKGSRARRATVVRVSEGLVGVRPTQMVAQASGKTPTTPQKPKGPRVQVPGPQEITADEWEKKFAELQANRQIAVGVDLWELAEYEEQAKRDAFAKWVEANQ